MRVRTYLLASLAALAASCSRSSGDSAPIPDVAPQPEPAPAPAAAPCDSSALQFDSRRTKCHLPLDDDTTDSVQWGDLDGDTDLDLVVANRGQNRLLLNDGGGVFSDATDRLPAASDFTEAIALGDIDGDGDLDIAFGNADFTRLYVNDGDARFTDATPSRLPESDSAAALAFGDIDNDGDLDLVSGGGLICELPAPSPCQFGRGRVFINDGTGFFTDRTVERIPGGGFEADIGAIALSPISTVTATSI